MMRITNEGYVDFNGHQPTKIISITTAFTSNYSLILGLGENGVVYQWVMSGGYWMVYESRV